MSKYGAALEAAGPGSKEFDMLWTELSKRDDFKSEQDKMAQTIFDRTEKKTKQALNLPADFQFSPAVKESMLATAVQYGEQGAANFFTEAFRGKNVAAMSDVERIDAIAELKKQQVDSRFKRAIAENPAVRDQQLRRIEAERKALQPLAMSPAPAESTSPIERIFNESAQIQALQVSALSSPVPVLKTAESEAEVLKKIITERAMKEDAASGGGGSPILMASGGSSTNVSSSNSTIIINNAGPDSAINRMFDRVMSPARI